MNINEAEKLTGITKKTIRYYEEEGLLKVRRDEKTGYRIFKEEDISRLKAIKLFRKIGIPIREIQTVINKENSLSVVLIRQIQELNNQLNTLQAKKELLESVLAEGNLQETAAEMIYDIEDILYCDPIKVKDKLTMLGKEAIILASMGASPQVNDLLQELLSEINIPEEQRKLGRVRTKDIEKAQTELIIHMNRSKKDGN